MKNTKAFPSKEFDLNISKSLGGTCFKNHEQGMDLRDYFAAKAMQGMVSSFYLNAKTSDSPSKLLEQMKLINKNAYWFADRMIKEREIK